MTGGLYEVSAQLAGYASELPPERRLAVFSTLADVITGHVTAAEAGTAVSRLRLPPALPRFGEWLETPEGAAAVANRVALQRTYDEVYRQPAQSVALSGRPSFRPPGVHFVPFFLQDVCGEAVIAKFTTSAHPLTKVLTVEEATAPLLIARDLHPQLEQVRGISYELGVVATQFMPGDDPEELTEPQIRAITQPQFKAGFQAARIAGEHGLLFDYRGLNVKISAQRGFGFLDLAKVNLDAPTLVARNAYGLLAITTGRLGRRAVWTPGLGDAVLAARDGAQQTIQEVVPPRHYPLRQAAKWYDSTVW